MENLLYSPVVAAVVVLIIIMTVTIIAQARRLREKTKESSTVSDMKTLTEELMNLRSSGQAHLNNDGKFNWSVGAHTIDYLESDPNSITVDGKRTTPMKTLSLILRHRK